MKDWDAGEIVLEDKRLSGHIVIGILMTIAYILFLFMLHYRWEFDLPFFLGGLLLSPFLIIGLFSFIDYFSEPEKICENGLILYPKFSLFKLRFIPWKNIRNIYIEKRVRLRATLEVPDYAARRILRKRSLDSEDTLWMAADNQVIIETESGEKFKKANVDVKEYMITIKKIFKKTRKPLQKDVPEITDEMEKWAWKKIDFIWSASFVVSLIVAPFLVVVSSTLFVVNVLHIKGSPTTPLLVKIMTVTSLIGIYIITAILVYRFCYNHILKKKNDAMTAIYRIKQSKRGF